MAESTSTTPAPTREQLRGEVELATVEHADAEKAHAEAISAMERARGDKSVTMEGLVELADSVRAAKATVDRKAATIATLNRRIANFDVIAKSDERNAAMTVIHDHVKAQFVDSFVKGLAATGVDKVAITIELDPFTIGVKPTGARLSAASGRVSGGGTGRGFKSSGPVTVDGTEYQSLNRAYVALRAAADGVDPADVTPANSESASRWLAKHGHTVA